MEDDPAQFVPVHVLARGDSGNPGDAVGMRPIGVLLPDGAPEWGDRIPTPRLALAKWITDPANPLTARVMVNRIWQHHFGAGLVATPNDFGRMGSRPSHPELLDWLANQFVEGGFRMKPLHRLILLSRAPIGRTTLPRRRRAAVDDRIRTIGCCGGFRGAGSSAEELRDAMLAVSGRLNPQKGGPSVIVPIEPELVQADLQPGAMGGQSGPAPIQPPQHLPVPEAQLRLPFMEVFDAPDLPAELPAPRAEHPRAAGPRIAERRFLQLHGEGARRTRGTRSRPEPRPPDRAHLPTGPGARPRSRRTQGRRSGISRTAR